MKYLSSKEIASKWKVSERSVRNYCNSKRVEGALLKGKIWYIPENCEKPSRKARPSFKKKIAYYHLPGLFEFYEFYKVFLPIYDQHKEYFYDWCKIGSIYGSPTDCIWNGGRVENSEVTPKQVYELMEKYHISARLTFSNSLLTEKHLSDSKCNDICKLFSTNSSVLNGIIIYSDLLLDYIHQHYPEFYFVSTTTKVLTNPNDFINELNRKDFSYVVCDFRLNKNLNLLKQLTNSQKDKVEFLCNECCFIGCHVRKQCYKNVSYKNLEKNYKDFQCVSPDSNQGYKFSKAMENPSFIGIDDIVHTYLPMGFSNFKIEGRSLGSALLLEFILYYMVRPEYQLKVREEIYLDNELDLF